MKWYVGGLDSSKVAYLPDLPSYDSILKYCLLFRLPLSGVLEGAEGYIYQCVLTEKGLSYFGNGEYRLADYENYHHKSFTFVDSDDESVSSALGYPCNIWLDDGEMSVSAGIDTTMDLFYSNYDVYNSDGTLFQTSSKIYNGDWWLYQFIGYPPLPDDRYDYNHIVRNSNGSVRGLFSFDVPFDYVFNDTGNIYNDKYLISKPQNYKIYSLSDNEWSLVASDYSEYTGFLDEAGGFIAWASYGLPSYSSETNIGTENRLWIYDLVSVNGIHYECSDYLPYGDSDGYNPDTGGGDSGGDDSGDDNEGGNTGGDTGGGEVTVTFDTQAFLNGLICGLLGKGGIKYG